MQVTVLVGPYEVQATLTTVAVSANGEIRVGLTSNVFDDLDTEMWSPE